MTLEVLTAGLQTSVVAAPFRGMRYQAMPMAGAADPLSLAIANRILGKAAQSAALEITLDRAVFRAGVAMQVAVAGAVRQVILNSVLQPAGKAVICAAGDVIEIGPAVTAMRSYLALSPDLDVAERMGSATTYLPGRFGGFGGRALRDADIVLLRKQEPRDGKHSTQSLGLLPVKERILPQYTHETILRIISGPESDPATRTVISSARWRVSNRMDRMGIALNGPSLTPEHSAQLSSSAVFPGTIQCPPGGQPFLLGVDGQTTGGYPRIAQVIRADRHLIGQLRPHSHVRFVPVDIATAHTIYRQKLSLWLHYIPDLRLD